MCTMCSTLCTVQRAVHIHNPGNVKMKLITRRRSASATAMVALVVCCSLLGICEAKRAASSAGGLAGMGISISTVGFITFIALLIGYFLFSKSDHTDNRSSNNRVSAFQAAPAAGLGSGQGQSQGRTNIGKRDVYLSEPNLRTIAALGLTEQPAVVSISVSTVRTYTFSFTCFTSDIMLLFRKWNLLLESSPRWSKLSRGSPQW